jgi:hypothetical protein
MQHSLREDAPGVREAEGHAVRASRPAPVTPALLARMLGIASVVALFLSLLGRLDIGLLQFAKRAGMYVVFGWSGCLLGLAASRLVTNRLALRNFWLEGLATGLIMFPPMAVVVALVVSLFTGQAPTRADLPGFAWQTAVICVGMSYLASLFARRTIVVVAAPNAEPPKFLERLPLRLRGGEVWAVEAEDHYLRLHTSKGQDLILMRLADAVTELEGIEGAQVHRSWWIARDAITGAERGDGRATLTLKDGAQVPVSRTYARTLRERGWI